MNVPVVWWILGSIVSTHKSILNVAITALFTFNGGTIGMRSILRTTDKPGAIFVVGLQLLWRLLLFMVLRLLQLLLLLLLPEHIHDFLVLSL